MNLLVDTCVWSLALRRKQSLLLPPEQAHALAELSAAVQQGRVVMIGAIRQEILSRIRDKAQFSKIAGLLDPFPDQIVTSNDYVEAARLFNICRDHGVECGTIDMLLCAVAHRLSCAILTFDQALLRCIKTLQTARQLPRF